MKWKMLKIAAVGNKKYVLKIKQMKESLTTFKNIKMLAFSVLDIILLYYITKMI